MKFLCFVVLLGITSKKTYYILEQDRDDIPCTYLYITPRWLELS